MRYIGFDPDYHNSGLAELVCSDKGVRTIGSLYTLKVHSSLKGVRAIQQMCRLACVTIESRNYHSLDVLMVEAPVVYSNKLEAKAAVWGLDLIAGAAAGAFPGRVKIVTPHQWKGTKKKVVHHKEILRDVEKLVGHNEIDDPTSHELDALGMALLAFNQDERLVRQQAARDKLARRNSA
jgi:hypothetical protein